MTGNVLITLLLLRCNSIMVMKYFWWMEIFFPQISGLILQLSGPLPSPAKTMVLYLLLILHCVRFSKKTWRNENFAVLQKKKLGKKYTKVNYMAKRNLLNVAKESKIFSLSPCLFWSFRVELQHDKNPAGIFIKMKRKHVALSGLIPYFPWLFHS